MLNSIKSKVNSLWFLHLFFKYHQKSIYSFFCIDQISKLIYWLIILSNAGFSGEKNSKVIDKQYFNVRQYPILLHQVSGRYLILYIYIYYYYKLIQIFYKFNFFNASFS